MPDLSCPLSTIDRIAAILAEQERLNAYILRFGIEPKEEDDEEDQG